MKRCAFFLVAIATCGLLLGVCYLVLAQDILERTDAVKQEMAREAAAHAALRGSQGALPEDNSLCLLCHANFREETLVTDHTKGGITCTHCHGISFEHMDDETSRTKPDIMHGRAEVAPFCQRCHGAHAEPDKVAAFLAQWKSNTRPNGRLILDQATCTDCHGEHAILKVPVVTGGP